MNRVQPKKAKEFIQREGTARNIQVNMDMIEVAIENAWIQLGINHDATANQMSITLFKILPSKNISI